jgi:hypothetical protein
MQVLKTKVSLRLGIALVVMLGCAQLASAQHRLTPIPHPIGAHNMRQRTPPQQMPSRSGPH